MASLLKDKALNGVYPFDWQAYQRRTKRKILLQFIKRHLKEMCNKIYQKYSNHENCHQTEWNINKNTYLLKREKKQGVNNTASTKKRNRWTKLKKIGLDCNCSFWKLVSLTVFQNSNFDVCNVWYNALETYLFETKLWFCQCKLFLKFHSD